MANIKTADDTFSTTIGYLVEDAEAYRDDLSAKRQKANDYYDGEMKAYVPEIDGRSRLVSRDVRKTIKKVLPSIVRVILGGDKVVEYQPVAKGDEASAEQATDYINNVVFPESNGYNAVQDAIHDALKLRNGIIRWWYDEKITTTVSKHTGLDEMSLVQLVADDDVTVLEQEQGVEQIDTPQGPAEVPTYTVKIRRRETRGITRLEAVAPEKFLIHPDALDIDESPLVGITENLRRTDLVAMGYDRDRIWALPEARGKDDAEEESRRRGAGIDVTEVEKSLQEVEYYELFVRIDEDGDGIAELRRLVYAGGIKDEYLFENEEWDEVPFADITCERRPHDREGHSVTDDAMDLQTARVVFLRETADNVYWQNNQQPIVREGAVVNPDSMLNPSFGKPIRISEEIPDVRAAVSWSEVPFVAQASFSMLEYLDRELEDRTGITDAAGGLAPDALQNVTAKASSLMEQAGVGQTELMVRTIAHGLKKVFGGLLKLVIKHQDKPRTVRLRDDWVTFDPRSWNASMDAHVNTGLGAGTRERDMMAMQVVAGLQEKLLAAFGAVNNPFVTPDNLYTALEKTIISAGLPSALPYLTKPTPEAIQQAIQSSQNKTDPEMEKIKAKAAADQAKAQSDARLEEMRLANEMTLRREEMEKDFKLKLYQIDKEMEMKARQNAVQVLSAQPVTPVHIGGDPG
ncbi:phage portal protein [Rhizobium sp. YJ-22]|uniref:portal protein n=1 Tax=Rhizobium sp. YJ-22 TaxID=3037556 RepID=UPI0024126DF2|nr:phage portal protein [Rhizobium sp. YJ-22]MDG3577133.1 phage portal protein [Rhizobium sp. YJ-22]